MYSCVMAMEVVISLEESMMMIPKTMNYYLMQFSTFKMNDINELFRL